MKPLFLTHCLFICVLVGRGGYGSVHLVREKETERQYAIKVIPMKQISMSKMIKREFLILQKMQHRNVLNLRYSFINNNRIYLVMDYIRGGNLKEIVERDHLTIFQLTFWFAELVLAVDYLHSIGIVHR